MYTKGWFGMLKKVSLIFSCNFDGGISYHKDILCSNPEIDRKFHRITSKCNDEYKMNAIIMGRKTWESLRAPIPNRINIIITTDYESMHHPDNNIIVCDSVINALVYCNNSTVVNDIFVIGGAGIIDTFLQAKMFFQLIDKVYLTVLFYNYEYVADAFIDTRFLFEKFKWVKDEYAKNTVFASYVCLPLTNSSFIMM